MSAADKIGKKAAAASSSSNRLFHVSISSDEDTVSEYIRDTTGRFSVASSLREQSSTSSSSYNDDNESKCG